MVRKFVFIYNAKSGIFPSIASALHKSISPNTYSCNLCKLTFGLLSMKKEWKKFIKSLKVDINFLHRDEFKKKYKYKTAFPVVLEKKGDSFKVFMNNEEINSIKSITDLMNKIKKRL